MRKTWTRAAALILALLLAAAPLTGCGQKKTLKKLHVQDTYLADAKGNPVQLKGISTHGLAWFPQYVNKELFHELSTDWNCQIIRLAMYTMENMGYLNGGDQEALKKLIDDGIRYCTEENMYAIIDWHILSDGNPNKHVDEAIEFFDEMSKKYADHDNVFYEICNEPNNCDWAKVKEYAEKVIPVIRKNAPDSIILVGTPSYSKLIMAPTYDMLDYDNILYVMHFYAQDHRSSNRRDLTDALAKGLPVFISEYGISDASGKGNANKEEGDLWMQVLDENHIGSVCWNLSNKDETCALIRPDVAKTSGFTKDDLTESGQWLYETLRGERKAK